MLKNNLLDMSQLNAVNNYLMNSVFLVDLNTRFSCEKTMNIAKRAHNFK